MIALVSFGRHNKIPCPGGLSNRNLLLTVLEAESPRASCQPHSLFGEALPGPLLLKAHTWLSLVSPLMTLIHLH